MSRSTILLPLLASVALHGAVGVWVKVRGADLETHSEVTRPDVWSGRGIEIEPASVVTESAAPASEPAMTPAEPTPSEANAPVALEPSCVVNCETRTTTSSDEPAAPPKPKPAPSVRAVASAAPASARAASSATSSGSFPNGTDVSATPGGAFGTVGLPPGVRYLPKAYVRALPQGGWGVAGFRTAPTGTLCEARIGVAVNEDRTIGPLDYGGERERELVPRLCRTLFENAHRLVSNGEFSLDAKSLAAGVMRLRVTIEVTDGEPRAEAEDAPHGLGSESYEPPSPGRRGRGTFTLNSGRRVDAFVELE